VTAPTGVAKNRQLRPLSQLLPCEQFSGQQGVAIQLIDQSPIAFDDVIFRDLTAAFATRVDLQVISGSGTSGQILGILQTPNIGSVTATSVDIKGVYSAVANAVQLVHTTRFLPPDVVVMHPRRRLRPNRPGPNRTRTPQLNAPAGAEALGEGGVEVRAAAEGR
jgi:Phage capsid family